MLKNMAVIHIGKLISCLVSESHNKFSTVIYPHCIFPAGIFCCDWPFVLRDNKKRTSMHVKGMAAIK